MGSSCTFLMTVYTKILSPQFFGKSAMFIRNQTINAPKNPEVLAASHLSITCVTPRPADAGNAMIRDLVRNT